VSSPAVARQGPRVGRFTVRENGFVGQESPGRRLLVSLSSDYVVIIGDRSKKKQHAPTRCCSLMFGMSSGKSTGHIETGRPRRSGSSPTSSFSIASTISTSPWVAARRRRRSEMCSARSRSTPTSQHLKHHPPHKVKGKHGEPRHWDGLAKLFVALVEENPHPTSVERAWLAALKGAWTSTSDRTSA